ncbi:MAG: flagellar motor protein MotB [Acidimicrobiales bacterium]
MARRIRHEEPEEHEGGMERWLLTYADMITLLLALFVVLFALSTISVVKFTALAQALRNTFSGHTTVVKNDTGLLAHNSLVDRPGSVQALEHAVSSPLSPSPVQAPPSSGTQTSTPASPPPPGSKPLTTIEAELQAALAAKGLAADVSMAQSARGLVVQILADKVFFASDSADLGLVGDAIVDTMSGVLNHDTNNIVVEGYTDNQPITGGPYSSNWELSAERGVHVVVRMDQVDGVNMNRLAATGYGETRPVVPNTNAANQRMNRRVDVVILAPGQDRA